MFSHEFLSAMVADFREHGRKTIAEDYERLAEHAERRAQKRAEGIEEDVPIVPGGDVVVRTPASPDLTYRFPLIRGSPLARLRSRSADDNGMPSHLLRHRRYAGSVLLNAFDLIELTGNDLRCHSARDKSLCD